MIIGLTGGIASGKSAITEILKAKNAYIIDADEVYLQLSANGSPLDLELKKTFPDCVVGGKLDRRLLKQRVFNNETDRLLLNSITHPKIFDEIYRQIYMSESNIAVIVVPLLFESGFDNMCDYTACVISPLEVRIERIIKRDKIDRTLAEKIISAQVSDKELAEKCDYIIYNDGDLDELKKRVDEWWG